MSARKKSASRKRATGKKDEEVAVVEPVVPVKSDEQLLEEQFALTMLSAAPSAPPPPRPLHSPSDVRWGLSVAEVVRFCFPAGVQHPRSRGRLWVLANDGPIVRRHSYTSCLCGDCQRLVREKRKDDPYVARVYQGELFTAANVNPAKLSKAQIEAQAEAAAAATAALRSSIPALSLNTTFASSATAATPTTTTPATPTQPLFPPISPVGASSAASAASATAAAASSPSRPSALFPASAPPTLHNSRPAAVAPLPSCYSTHSVDQLSFLCAKCSAHARSAAHVLGGKHGRHVLSGLELDELARRLDEEDLLEAYGRLRKLAPAEERDFLAKLDGEKVARAKLNYTQKQLEHLLEPLGRLPNADGSPSSLIDFYEIQTLVNGQRQERIERLSQMYPDVATKADRSQLQDQAVALRQAPGAHTTLSSAAAKRSAIVTVRLPTSGSGSGSGRGGEGGNGAEEKDSGVVWPGESMLTYSMLTRKFPPHQSHELRTRLLHKHTHQVAELGSAVNHPSIQLSVALMRNQHLNDRTEGWHTQF